MKLSEAIRVGSEKSSEVSHITLVWGAPGEPVQACALGAAWLATHEPPWNEADKCRGLVSVGPDLREAYLFLRESIAWPGPADCGYIYVDMEGCIMELMDRAHWTRAQIADWVESLGY